MKNSLIGFALGDQLPNGRAAVQIVWSNDTISIESKDLENLNFSDGISSWDFVVGGNRNRFLFLKNTLRPEVQVYLEISPELISILRSHPVLSERLRNEIKGHRKQKTSLIFTIVIVASLFVGFITYRGVIARELSRYIPFSAEKKIGDLFWKTKPATEAQAKTLAQLQVLMEPLYASHPELREQLTFHISSDKAANAYATVGGHIVVNRGLIEGLKTPEQLLGVIAHEVTHVKDRHVLRGVLQGAGLFIVVQALFGDVTGVVAVLVDQGTPLLLLKHSRDLEIEADQKAVEILLSSKVNPYGLSESLRWLDAEAKKLLQQTPAEDVAKILSKLELWSTHPEMDGRIRSLEEYIQKRLNQGELPRPLEFRYQEFVESTRSSF